MWLTSWWVAWLLNFYGFSHTNCMVFYRTPWTRYGIPWNCIGTSGNPMAFHGTPQYSMEFHGIPWNSITTSWNSVELHGIPWNSMDTPWNSKAFHRTSSMEFHRFPSISMEFHSMEVFHTGTGCKLFAGVSPFKYGNYVLTIMCYAIMQPSHKRPV